VTGGSSTNIRSHLKKRTPRHRFAHNGVVNSRSLAEVPDHGEPHGSREEIRRRVNALVASASEGRGNCVVLDGAPGSGRTLLITAALAAAERCSLPALLIDPSAPVADQFAALVPAVRDRDLPSATATAFALHRDLARRTSPLLICIDDLPRHGDVVHQLAVLAAESEPGAVLWIIAAQSAALPQATPLSLEPPGEGPMSTVQATPEVLRRILSGAALLGMDFTALDAAELLSLPIGALLRPLRTALRTGVLEEYGERLRFSHQTVRDAFRVQLRPDDVVLLAGRAVDLLARRGGQEHTVTEVVLHGSTQAGAKSLDLLRQGLEIVGPRDVRLASAIEQRMLTVLDARGDEAATIRAELVVHLGQAGSIAEARAVAPPQGCEPDAALWFARSQLEFPFSFVASRDAARSGLRTEPPDPRVRARLLCMAVLAGMLCEPEQDEAEIAEAVTAAKASGDPRALALCDVLRGLQDFARHEWNMALRRASAASAPDRPGPDHPEWWFASLLRANLLRVRGRHSQARSFVDDQALRAETRGQTSAAALLLAVRASIDLDAGRLSDASIHASAALRLAERIGERRLVLVDVASVLMRVARLRGDLPQLQRWQKDLLEGSPELHRAPVVAELLLIAADATDRTVAPEVLTPDLLDEDLTALSISRDLGDDVLRCRILLRLGRRSTVTRQALSARRRAERSRSPLAMAVSDHLEGLVDGSADALQRAIAQYRALRRPLLEASASEDAAGQEATPRDEAEVLLRRAAAIWESCGSRRDHARVARRLREMGVRLPLPAEAAPGLTAAETRVLRELLKRQTTAEIASVLSLSRHTVSVHLRRIYAKAGVGSRTALIDLIESRR